MFRRVPLITKHIINKKMIYNFSKNKFSIMTLVGGVSQLVEHSNSMQEVPFSNISGYFRIFLDVIMISDDQAWDIIILGLCIVMVSWWHRFRELAI